MAHDKETDDALVGVTDIAARFDVETNSAWRWTRRDDFPTPAIRLGSGRGSRRAWRLADVEAWAEKSLPLKPGPKPREAPPS